MKQQEHYLLPIISFYQQIMKEGEGSYIIDSKGKQYLDLNAGQFCSVFGNKNTQLVNYMKDNMDRLLHTNTELITEEVITASKNINRISGDMDAYSIFLSTGAEAVEFCLRFAKQMKKKKGIVCFDKGYHGLTLGAQSVTFGGRYTAPEVTDIYSIEVPDYDIPKEEIGRQIQQLEDLFKQHHDNIAAVLMEPIASVGGMIFPPKSYFQDIRRLCDEYDVLLIFDECQTGFARTGSWFYYQEIDCVPDMLACAKAIGLGFPVSVALFKAELVDQIHHMTHYSSHQNDGFAAMLINFGIQYIEENSILHNNKIKGDFFLKELKKLEQTTGRIKNARGHGLMLGLDLCIADGVDSRRYYRTLSEDAMQEGVIIQGTNAGRVLRFLPNYLITDDEIIFAIGVLETLLK